MFSFYYRSSSSSHEDTVTINYPEKAPMSDNAPRVLPSKGPSVTEINTTKETSKIVRVSLHPSGAEIVRSYQFEARAGQNKVKIRGLPDFMENSLRVDGKGKDLLIHDVVRTSKWFPPEPSKSTSLPHLEADKAARLDQLAKATDRLAILEDHLAQSSSEPSWVVDKAKKLKEKLDQNDTRREHQDSVRSLEKSIEETDRQIKRMKEKYPETPEKWSYGVDIDVSVAVDGPLELILTYAVKGAEWSDLYDIRVSTNQKEKQVELVCKAGLRQNTGETWENVPIFLETSPLTDNVSVPTLEPSRVSVLTPIVIKEEEKEDAHLPISMNQTNATITSRGNINATFRIPGLITVPNDNSLCTVKVSTIVLDAEMEWIAVPRVDSKTRLIATIKNTSDFVFLAGESSVYLDGSFLFKHRIPFVNVQETFKCPLGVDPSIQVTYHPLILNTAVVSTNHSSEKVKTQAHIQTVTVHNSKPLPVKGVQIIDQVPVSGDDRVTVRLISPKLILPGTTGFQDSSTDEKYAAEGLQVSTFNATRQISGGLAGSTQVQDGVVARWDSGQADDGASLGKDGRFKWICDLGASQKTTLKLEWEVSVADGLRVTGP